MALTSTFSVFRPVEFVSSGGILVRQVDSNGVALDDGVTVFSTAKPIMSINSQGRSSSLSLAYGDWRKVTLSALGRPVVRVDATGAVINTPFTVPAPFRTAYFIKSLSGVTLSSNATIV